MASKTDITSHHVKIVMLVLFSHNDFPLAIRDIFNNDLEGWNFDSDLSQHPKLRDYPMDHTDLQRMKKGRVGGQVRLAQKFTVCPEW